MFFIASNIVTQTNKKNESNLKVVANSNEFKKLSNFFLSKINSPYQEIKYTIQNNDSIERILKKYDVKNEDIKKISVKLKQQNLSNIYSGRELTLITKKTEDGSNKVINLLFPINNTSSVEIRKYQNEFHVKENIIQLEF